MQCLTAGGAVVPVVVVREAVPVLLVAIGFLDQEPVALTLAGVGILVLVLSLALQLSSREKATEERQWGWGSEESQKNRSSCILHG